MCKNSLWPSSGASVAHEWSDGFSPTTVGYSNKIKDLAKFIYLATKQLGHLLTFNWVVSSTAPSQPLFVALPTSGHPLPTELFGRWLGRSRRASRERQLKLCSGLGDLLNRELLAIDSCLAPKMLGKRVRVLCGYKPATDNLQLILESSLVDCQRSMRWNELPGVGIRIESKIQ